jgi:polysaccharide pyruvyl transferase WcaK-like protein
MEIISAMNGETKIAEASVCVTRWFHGSIFSITATVPTIAVPYYVKLQQLFQFLNLGEWIADLTLKSLNHADYLFFAVSS